MAEKTALKALVLAGCGSRRAMADAIKQGRVTCDGTPVESFTQEMCASADLRLDGKPVRVGQQGFLYLMLNKPVGVLSTTIDERGRRTVMDLLPTEYRSRALHPVGRLDLDSSGLLLLTDDGALTQALTHPSFEKEKEYLVTLDRELDEKDKASFERGVELTDGMTSPARVMAGDAARNYYVTLHEGRKRQIRRMFGVLGYRVMALKRVRVGSLALGDLPEGKLRALSPSEIASILAK
jgi:23S rRNA pseudouridine2605 synthase